MNITRTNDTDSPRRPSGLLVGNYYNRPLLLRRPKVVFFGAQAEKNRLFFFFRRRLNMVFDGQISFSTPPKTFPAPKIFCPQLLFFFIAPKNRTPLLFRRPKVVFFGAQAEKPRFFLFFFSAPPRYGVRRPNNFFDPPNFFSAAFRRFSAPKNKNRLFRQAPKE